MTGETPKDDDVNPEKELEVAAGDNAQVPVTLYDGTEIMVYRCKVRHAAKIAKLFNTVLIGLNVHSMEGVNSIEIDNPQVLISVLEIAFDDTVEAIEALTSLSKEQVLDLDIDDLLTIVAKAVEINRDFFLKRVSAALSKLAPQEKAAKSAESP